MPGELKVVATAGHVDHGKSSLILRLTGIDPDRWAEEKRRGLTIDLGYAWTTLPSGREIGFVDVPGHERFIGNMLAGVGPVRLVLFVVAADEGWKPQSEEHLQILDVLGVRGGVVALTKRDLVDDEALALAEAEVRERLSGTGLASAPIVAVSSTTGEGFDALSAALERMLDDAGDPEEARARLFVDRVFTIKGAGTVVTGTLGGDCLHVGDEVELYPSGATARIRSLQTHERAVEQACPVSRVAANLVGVEREELSRGAVLGAPGAWRATTALRGAAPARPRALARDHGSRRVQAPRGRRRDRCAPPAVRHDVARARRRGVRPDPDLASAGAGCRRPVRDPRGRSPRDGGRGRGAGRRAAHESGGRSDRPPDVAARSGTRRAGGVARRRARSDPPRGGRESSPVREPTAASGSASGWWPTRCGPRWRRR